MEPLVDLEERRRALMLGIRSGEIRTVREAADVLGISPRTVIRDVTRLQEDGEPVARTGPKGRGLALEGTPTPTLSPDAITGLLLAIDLCNAVAPGGPFAEAATRATAQLYEELPPQDRDAYQLLHERTQIGPSAPASAAALVTAPSPEVLSTIARALAARSLVDVRYAASGQDVSVRRLEPQGLLLQAPIWSLLAWDPGPDGPRLLRADRIEHVEVVTSTRFELRVVDTMLAWLPTAVA